MATDTLAIIYFIYGLAFFSMGLAIILEVGRAGEHRLRLALLPLAIFGLLHGLNEWLEMFELLDLLPSQFIHHNAWNIAILAILLISFLSLAQFGAFLLIPDENKPGRAFWFPFALLVIWMVGVLVLLQIYPSGQIFDIINVWTRYSVAVPAALMAAAGLIMLQREFRNSSLAGFGRDALWAAVALFWYGVIGQTFVRATELPPSDVINQGLFLHVFGFPVQLLRATAALVVAIFIIRFLRSFEVEIQREINELQAERLEEARRREALRGDILRQIVAAQEAERQRIARELHDETGQALTAIGMGLRGATTTLRSEPEKASQTLRQLEGMAAKSISELRRIIADLRPSHLDDLGLAATLRWYANDVEERINLKVRVETTGEVRPLPAEMTTTLFRVAQEAINNTIRHSQASQAVIRLCYCPEGVRVEVEDNGIGFDPTRVDRSHRSPFGLLGMRERAILLGGTFAVESTPGKGTKILVGIPYPPDVGGQNDGHSSKNPDTPGR